VAGTVRDNPAQQRYEIVVDDGTVGAYVEYMLQNSIADFVHTQTVSGFEGQGLASALIRGALDDARRRGWQIRPYCPFVRRYLGKHAEYVDLVSEPDRVRFGLA
jgi:uncharacterized protein